MMKLRAIAILLLLQVVYASGNRPIIKIKNGIIKGTIQKTMKGREYFAFEGIPYAKPPVGELRLKEPQPAESWTGIWDASYKYQCMQINHVPNNPNAVEGSEDCLYVNVYTPNIVDDKLMDVIVHIHGGAFMFGEGSTYGPRILMDKNVVYVNLNYRLGPLGFMSTEDEHLPGNNGLKDQALALKWIKENIKYFNGNPNSVTITGCSAGGASVHLHYMSPLSKGLFHKGISSSGTAFSNWAIVENPLKNTRTLATHLGCGQTSTKEIVECLRSRTGHQITQTVREFYKWLSIPYVPFGPVVEKNVKNAFLSSSPQDLMKSGKVLDVPWITSLTLHEGLYPAAEFYFNDTHLPHLEKHWDELVEHVLVLSPKLSANEVKEVSTKIKDEYFKGKPISKDTFQELVQLLSDRLFFISSEKAARMQATVNKSPVYFYMFGYRGDASLTEYLGGDENIGVSHADDVFYVFYIETNWFKKYMKSKSDKKMASVMRNIYESFAKTGKPTIPGVEWTNISKNDNSKLVYLNILSPNDIKMEEVEHLGNKPFWDQLPLKEYGQMHRKDEL